MATRTHDLTAQVDGVNVLFITPENFIAGTLEVHHNGSRLRKGIEFTETTPASFTWVVAPKFPAPKTGDTLLVQYEQLNAGDPEIFPLVIASGIDPTM